MPDIDIASLGLFQGEEHQGFHWQTGRPAVLLIHGFMGTPAEMRPLGEAFRQAGWTVQGLLLPGFGPQLPTLFERRYQEWTEAALAALDALRAQHEPVVLAGYSMGAAVALQVAAEQPPNGLVLMAPFWRIGTPVQRLIWQIAKRIFRRPQPFKRANFGDPRLRQFLGGLLPELDLDDPATQRTLRQVRVPASFADQVIDAGKAAAKAAPHVKAPTLIVQGIEDEAVSPEATRQLLAVFPGPIHYQELLTGHELVRADDPCYAQFSALILHFATELAA